MVSSVILKWQGFKYNPRFYKLTYKISKTFVYFERTGITFDIFFKCTYLQNINNFFVTNVRALLGKVRVDVN